VSTQIDSWQAAERNAAEAMRTWGFTDARVTAGGADSGVDVHSKRALAQVKFEAALVGRPVLQRLVGTRPPRSNATLLCFSGTGYSAHALTYADMHDIALFTYTLTGRVDPVNSPARQIMHGQRLREQRQKEMRQKFEAKKAEITARGPRNPSIRLWAVLTLLSAFTAVRALVDHFRDEPMALRFAVISAVIAALCLRRVQALRIRKRTAGTVLHPNRQPPRS
jgi:Restriction endonuclease